MSTTTENITAVGNTLLVATPNELLRAYLSNNLALHEFNLEFVSGGAEALVRLERESCWVVLLDKNIMDLSVGELYNMIHSRFRETSIWVVGFDEGFISFEAGPVSTPLPMELESLLSESFMKRDVKREATKNDTDLERLNQQVSVPMERRWMPGVIGSSEAIRNLESLVRLVVNRSTPVLLTGETGTGKELVAKAIHQLGPRSRRPFIIVNCAAIPETLFESELFGYSRGAFTGAVESRQGRIQAANTGTLFLDEIGELPLSMQAKILRFLQEGEVQRLGSHDPCRVDVRIVAATNADLLELVEKRQFREDLFYRLSVFPIDIEPLRARPSDVGLLAQHFIDQYCADARTQSKYLTPAAITFLQSHDWPGNVRELKHATERACIMADQSPVIVPEHFSLIWRRASCRYSYEPVQKSLMMSR